MNLIRERIASRSFLSHLAVVPGYVSSTTDVRIFLKVSDTNCPIGRRLFFEFSVQRMPATNPLRLTGLRSPLGIGNRSLRTATRYFEN